MVLSIAASVAVTIVVLIVVLAAIGSQVGPSAPGDDMSGLWVVIVGGLILITVGPLSLMIAFVIISRRLDVPSRGRWAAAVGGILLVVAAVGGIFVRMFLQDRGVGGLTWLVVIALAGVAVATARTVTRYSPGRREQVVIAVGLAVVVGSVGIGLLNADRHDRAVSAGIIERRGVTLALPTENATWTVVDMSSPTGYTARELRLTATLRDGGGREVLLDPHDARYEPCYQDCVAVATTADGRTVRTKPTEHASWYVVGVGAGHWGIWSDDQLAPDEAAALFDQLRPVTIDEWLDTDRSLEGT